MSELRCCYCNQLISTDHDAQRVNKREVAHTTCAWAVDEAFRAAQEVEAMEEEDGEDG